MKEISIATIGSEIREHWKRLALAALVVAVAISAVLISGVDLGVLWDNTRTWLESLNDIAFVLAIAVLPVGGVSITLVYVVTGAKFGGVAGLAVIAFATAAHLLLTHLVARSLFARPLQSFLRRRGYKLPHLDGKRDAAFVTLMALVPGPPYAVRNYLLALSGLPLRRYFGLCWLIYVARSCVAIFLGGWAGERTTLQLGILVVVWLIKFSICAYIVQRLLRRRRKQRA